MFRRIWARPWIGRRNQYGAYHSLIQELSAEDPNGLKNFLRMDMASFNELFEIVTPLIKRRDTLMRNSISPAERLALTLQFLATGEPSALGLIWESRVDITCDMKNAI
jgi:hypothetical protein